MAWGSKAYNSIVARAIPLLVLWTGLLWAQPPQHAEPEEEDKTGAPREYAFNPIQAENELRVGRFYLKRGNVKGAAGRFEEATRWNPQSAEAWLALGEARERLKDGKAALAAYERYLGLAPEGKDAGEVKKRVLKLKPKG